MLATSSFIARRSRIKANGDASPLLVFADDWGRHPSSCQHLVRFLLRDHDVDWVNTIATRPPRLDLSTLRRGFEKIRHWTGDNGNAKQSDRLPRLRVLNPGMWPWQDTAFGRPFNRELLLRQLSPRLRSPAEAPIAVATIPVIADLVGRLRVERWVYYCVDDFSAWPGLDGDNLRRMEERLVKKADVLIAASAFLEERLAAMGRSAFVLTHGVDVDFWRSGERPLPAAALDLPRPLVVFWGLIDQRMDVAFVRRLSADMTRGTILLVGPEAAPDGELYRLPRVRRLPPLEFEELPAVARAAEVLIMPYADLPVTRAMQPLKAKEYLASGKPAVVRDLPATRPWGDCLDLARTADEFSRAVRLRLESGLPLAQAAARTRLSVESWSAKARAFEQMIGAGPAVTSSEWSDHRDRSSP